MSGAYEIRSADGTLIAVHVRVDRPDGTKTFHWKSADGSTGLNGTAVADLPMFGSEMILADGDLVVVTEGEKSALAVREAGYRAVGTVTGAAATPADSSLAVLAGHDVVLWPDADDVGRAHMMRIADRLPHLGVGSLRIVSVPGASNGADAADVDVSKIGGLVAAAEEAPEATTSLDAALWPAPPAEVAYSGLAGDLVRAVAPLTEADPAGLLGLILTVFGALAGHWTTFYQGSAQAANLYLLLVGDSSVGRKGTAWSVVREIFSAAAPGWESILVPGLGSGEGLIEHLKPPDDPPPGSPQHEHRALVLESEYGRLLAVMKREGSSLSPVIRDAWDGQPIGRFLARSRTLVLWHHVALIGMITPVELRSVLTSTDQANGFANRHMHVLVRRTKLLPFPESPRSAVTPFLATLRESMEDSRRIREMKWSIEGAMAWDAFYGRLAAKRQPGLLGAMLARAEAQVARLALIYAMMDRASEVSDLHLESAEAYWRFSEESAAVIYGRSTGDRNADALLVELRSGPMDMTEVRDRLGLRMAADRDAVVTLLLGLGLVRRTSVRTGGRGRPKDMLVLVAPD